MLDSALSAAHYVVAPTQSDDGSILGLERMARRLANTRARYNPALELLGVAVFNIAATDKRIVSEVREQLVEALGGYAPVFDSFIRNARKASRDMRSRGLLAYEYQEAADNAEPWYRSMKNPSELEGVTARLTYAANAAALASDYVALSAEILRRYQERLGTAQMMAIA